MANDKELQEYALTLKRDVVEAVFRMKDGHPGPCFSIAEIMSVLFFEEMHIDCTRPDWEDRDRFVLSKGHACPILYAALAHKGFFPIEELYTSLRMIDSRMQGHPYALKTPGLDSTAGSLGNGVGIALGMALAARIKKQALHTYAICGDGELGEGLIWESAMAAAHLKVDKLTVFIDNNNFQSGGTTQDISGPDPIGSKWESFGWHVQEIDGHDICAIKAAIRKAHQETERPSAIVCKTVKGNGVSFMVGDNTWHKRVFTEEEYAIAMKELGGLQ